MVKDHMGNEFKNQESMCKYWNINSSTLHRRLKRGWSLERALTEKPTRGRRKTKVIIEKFVTDHEGNKFKNTTKMCEHYGITLHTFKNRIRLGWSLKRTLTEKIHIENTKRNCVECFDHLGNRYASIDDMCAAYDIDRYIYKGRLNLGWSLEEILTTPIKRKQNKDFYGICEDHLGNKYKSTSAMCKHYRIAINTFKKRRLSGWSLQDALTIPISSRGNKYEE